MGGTQTRQKGKFLRLIDHNDYRKPPKVNNRKSFTSTDRTTYSGSCDSVSEYFQNKMLSY